MIAQCVQQCSRKSKSFRNQSSGNSLKKRLLLLHDYHYHYIFMIGFRQIVDILFEHKIVLTASVVIVIFLLNFVTCRPQKKALATSTKVFSFL